MAVEFIISVASANAALDALCALLNGGKLRIYDGTKPDSPDDAITTQNLLAEIGIGNPAFGAADAGVATANALTKDSDADATGTASWYRAFKSDGTTAVCDGTVGTSGCDMNMNSVEIQEYAEVSITSWTLTLPTGE